VTLYKNYWTWQHMTSAGILFMLQSLTFRQNYFLML
jgi:hypothetical protein